MPPLVEAVSASYGSTLNFILDLRSQSVPPGAVSRTGSPGHALRASVPIPFSTTVKWGLRMRACRYLRAGGIELVPKSELKIHTSCLSV